MVLLWLYPAHVASSVARSSGVSPAAKATAPATWSRRVACCFEVALDATQRGRPCGEPLVSVAAFVVYGLAIATFARSTSSARWWPKLGAGLAGAVFLLPLLTAAYLWGNLCLGAENLNSVNRNLSLEYNVRAVRRGLVEVVTLGQADAPAPSACLRLTAGRTYSPVPVVTG